MRTAPGRLEARRHKTGRTQAAIADALGVTQPTVQRWFARDQVPATYQARVAALLGVRLGWLVGDGGPEVAPENQDDAFAAGRAAGVSEAIRVLVEYRRAAGLTDQEDAASHRVAKDAAAREADGKLRGGDAGKAREG